MSPRRRSGNLTLCFITSKELAVPHSGRADWALCPPSMQWLAFLGFSKRDLFTVPSAGSGHPLCTASARDASEPQSGRMLSVAGGGKRS